MPNIVEITDFVGSFKVSTDEHSEIVFEDTRTEYQFELLYDMLGAELANLFIADLNSSGVPQTPIYTALFEAFQEDNGCEVIKSEGIKTMVKAYIYFKFCRDNGITVAITGNVNSQSENSQPVSKAGWLVRKYNQAIETAQAIQWYIGQNSADYPTYNGQELEFMPLY